MLPQKVYEFLRWTLTIVIPAALTLFTTLNVCLGWGINGDAVTSTVTAIATFLGVVFGINKIANDKKVDS